MTVSVSTVSGGTTDVDRAGRLREEAYARYRAGEMGEPEFVAVACAVMAEMPERCAEWLAGYALSRFGGPR